MKVGLFICDHVSKDYQATFGDYPDMFAQLFPELDFLCYDVCNNHFPNDLNECDVYMATGSKHSAYDNIDWIHQLKEVIKTIHEKDKYFIGFCFGHQLMGEALGGKVMKSPNGWSVGVHRFDIHQQEDWMQPSKSEINLLMMCQDQVLQLPENAVLLAGNKQCPVGMFRVGNKMLGIQAHPEFSKQYNLLLMKLRVERMGKATVGEGIKSLEKTIDKSIIHDWVMRFIGL